ncbi:MULTISPECIES: hypothetical protein [Morganella]|nr:MULTISPECIES: hypothetical protein [Morganella]QXO65867.1 hypothetical protein JC825_02490 [Morganella morganii]
MDIITGDTKTALHSPEKKHRQPEQQRQLHHPAPVLKAVKGRYVNP